MKTIETLRIEALATEAGRRFINAGFAIVHNGGGLTAWEKELPNGRRILITDSEGVDHTLSDASANDPTKPDHWLIGLHDGESDIDFMEAATADDAVAAALAMLFTENVRGYFDPATLADIDRTNRANNDGTCATGDLADSNMFMGDAFETLFGRITDVSSQAETDLWNRAWDMAKARGFSKPTN